MGNNYFLVDAKLQSLQLLISFCSHAPALLPTFWSNFSVGKIYTRQITVGESVVTTAKHDPHLVVWASAEKSISCFSTVCVKSWYNKTCTSTDVKPFSRLSFFSPLLWLTEAAVSPPPSRSPASYLHSDNLQMNYWLKRHVCTYYETFNLSGIKTSSLLSMAISRRCGILQRISVL